MQFLRRQNALKYVFGRGFAPDPAGGAQNSPRPPIAALRGVFVREETVRKKKGEREWDKR